MVPVSALVSPIVIPVLAVCGLENVFVTVPCRYTCVRLAVTVAPQVTGYAALRLNTRSFAEVGTASGLQFNELVGPQLHFHDPPWPEPNVPVPPDPAFTDAAIMRSTTVGKPDHVFPHRPEIRVCLGLHLEIGQRHVAGLPLLPDLDHDTLVNVFLGQLQDFHFVIQPEGRFGRAGGEVGVILRTRGG